MRGAELIEYLTKPPPTEWHEREMQPVYMHDVYLDALERDYKRLGLEFDRSKFEVDFKPSVPVHRDPDEEMTHPFGDLYLDVTYTKTRVKLKVNYALYNIHERYFARGKTPPLRTLVQALKSVGHTDDFLKKVILKHEENKAYHKKLWKFVESKLFGDEKKKKKAKKEKVVAKKEEEEDIAIGSDEENDDDDDDEENDDDVDGEFDMEKDDEDDAVVEDDDVAVSDLDDD